MAEPSQPTAPLTPLIELGEMLHEYHLGLVLIAGNRENTAELPVQWVHVSELEDPTPFLTPRTVLLTTGARFTAMQSKRDAEAYVRRLQDAGTTALGVAVGLHWDRVPPGIVSACDRLGLPLFRVPYDTAFIAVVQTAARLLDAKVRERDIWALESQRAVTRASLHSDGLGAVLREAASRLGRWVCITDRSGRIIDFAPRPDRETVQPDRETAQPDRETARPDGDSAQPEWIRKETRRLLERGVSAGRIGTEAGGGIQMQVLGRQGQALGVLVSQDGPTPDTAERTLLGLVAALATVQLEHRAGLDTAQAELREAIVQLLLADSVPLAEKLAAGTSSRIPHGTIAVVRYGSVVAANFLEEFRSLDAGSPGVFTATLDSAALVIAETRHLPAIRRLLLTHHVPAGISERGTLHRLGELVAQADRALEAALESGSEAPVDYLPALHAGVLRLLGEHPEARARADSLLAPVTDHDARHSDRIAASLTAWLAHHGHTSNAAAELGIHRHTLKARVQTAAGLLQADLDSPDVRAELWAALRLLDTPELHPPQ